MGKYLPLYVKAPGESLKYTLNWADWLAASETISTSSFTVPAGITKVSESNTTTSGTVKLSGGTLGTTYRCTHTVTTSDSQTAVRMFDIRVEDR